MFLLLYKSQISFVGLLVNHGSNKVQSVAVFKWRGRFKSPKHKNPSKKLCIWYIYRIKLKIHTLIIIVIYWYIEALHFEIASTSKFWHRPSLPFSIYKYLLWIKLLYFYAFLNSCRQTLALFIQALWMDRLATMQVCDWYFKWASRTINISCFPFTKQSDWALHFAVTRECLGNIRERK